MMVVDGDVNGCKSYLWSCHAQGVSSCLRQYNWRPCHSLRGRDREGEKDKDKQRQSPDVAIIVLKSTDHHYLIDIHHDLKVCERESGQLV